ISITGILSSDMPHATSRTSSVVSPYTLFSRKWIRFRSSDEADVPVFCIRANKNLQVEGLIMNIANSELLAAPIGEPLNDFIFVGSSAGPAVRSLTKTHIAQIFSGCNSLSVDTGTDTWRPELCVACTDHQIVYQDLIRGVIGTIQYNLLRPAAYFGR
ncbi:uncharacterized protein BKA55DRAFT_526676, partial [Fusarium redolens]